jgi:hypothetical protein
LSLSPISWKKKAKENSILMSFCRQITATSRTISGNYGST